MSRRTKLQATGTKALSSLSGNAAADTPAPSPLSRRANGKRGIESVSGLQAEIVLHSRDRLMPPGWEPMSGHKRAITLN